LIVCLQEHELQIWCPAPLPEGEQHWRKLRSDKYKPPAGRLLEFFESDLSVEADEDTNVEGGDDAGTGPEASGAAKPRRRTRSAVGKQSASAVATVVSAVKATEKKKKRKRKATSPPAVVTPAILTPQSREVESEEEEEEEEKEKDEAIEESPVTEDRLARRSESPATKRQQEMVEKTSEDALRRGLEAQRAAAATQARMPAATRPWLFRPKLRIPISAR
jgi:hypothetical protein